MPYRKIGYRTVSQGRLLIPSAIRILAELEKFGLPEATITQNLVKHFTAKLEVRPIQPTEWLGLRENEWLRDDTNYRSLMYVIYRMLHSGNLSPENYTPSRIEYVTNPIMTVDEMINEALGEYVDSKLPPSDHWVKKDKTIMLEFAGQVLYTIQELSTIARKRIEFLDHFQRYFGNLLYQMYDGTIPYSSLGAWEKSVLAIYIYGADMKYKMTSIGVRGGQAVPLRFPVARDTDPILNETAERLRKVCHPGNWTNFNKIISNKDPRELMYVVAPVVENLTYWACKHVDFGPFTSLREWREVASFKWGDENMLRWFSNQVQFQNDHAARYLTTGWKAPASHTSLMLTDLNMDHDMVDMKFQAVSQSRDRLVASWRSERLGHTVSDLTGGTASDMLHDMALGGSKGTVDLDMGSLEKMSWVDLGDASMEGREITNMFTSRNLNEIFHNVFYIRNGRVEYAQVEMTLYYYNMSTMGFLPALCEYMRLPRESFLGKADEKLKTYVLQRLNLSRHDAMETEEYKLLDVSLLCAMFTMFTGQQPVLDVPRHIRGACDREFAPSAENLQPLTIR